MDKKNKQKYSIKFQYINPESINQKNVTCFYRFGNVPETLVESIQNTGILSPLLVYEETPNTFIIVNGWRRYFAAKELHFEEIPAQILDPSSLSLKDALLLSVSENASRYSFCVMEKALLLQRALAYSNDDPVYFKNILMTASIPATEHMLTHFKALHNLPVFLQEFVNDETIQPDIALEIASLSEEDMKHTLSFYQLLRPGINRQKELFVLLKELSITKSKSITALILEENIQHILKNTSLSTPQKLNAVLVVLKKMRFPHLTELEKKFHSIKKAMKLPPEVSFSASPFFEDSRFKLSFTFKTQNDYDTVLDLLSNASKKGIIKNIEHLTDC